MNSRLASLGTTEIVQPAEPSGPTLNVIDVYELLKREFPPRENILWPWLPMQGLCMVYGSRGTGKTHVSLGIAYAVASGGEFLGWKAERPHGVLFVDGEMPAVVLQERLAAIVAGSDREPSAPMKIITPDLNTDGMIDISCPEDQALLDRHLDGIDLIIVDNLSTLCRTGKENEGEGWLPVQQWALQQRAAGRSVLFIHHANKSGGQRGSSRREDVLDTVVALRRPGDYNPEEGARFEIHFEKARGICGDETKPMVAQLKTSAHGFPSWELSSLEQSVAEKVAALIREGLPQSEIAELLGTNKSSVSRAKKRAEKQGLLP